MSRETRIQLVLCVVVVASIVGFSALVAYGTLETVTVTVVKTERVSVGSGETLHHMYLVYTTGETFRNSDSLWHGKFNSSDFHGRLEPGTYSMTVCGFRIPVLSNYRNIIEFQKVQE